MKDRTDKHTGINAFLSHGRQLERAFALGEPAPVRFERQRNVPEARRRKTCIAIEQDLPRRTRNEVSPADHLRHAHCRIIGHHRKLIGIAGGMPSDDEVAAEL